MEYRNWLMFNIYDHYRPIKRTRDFSPEVCDEFISRMLKYYKRKLGHEPIAIMVPIDYTGQKEVVGIDIIFTGKPRGHYYVTHEQNETYLCHLR